MAKITKEQIKEWKEQYGGFYELVSDNLSVFVKDPTQDLRIMKQAITAVRKGDITSAAESILNNCWLEGDEKLKEPQYLMGLKSQIDNLIELPEYEIIDKGNKVVVVIEDFECELRKVQRGDLKYAQDKNRSDRPFDTQMYLIDRVATDKKVVDEIRKHVPSFMALLLAVNDIEDAKYVEIKKY